MNRKWHEMTTRPTLDRRDMKHQLSEYTTLELASVLAHAENNRRQMDRFVESITAELTRRRNIRERVMNPVKVIAGALVRRRQRGFAPC
jgi:hypothetical protein